MPNKLPTIDDVRAAAERIAPHVHRTPVITSRAIDAWCGARVTFKCENLQRAGAFKMRGATNAVFSLSDDEARRGVVTHSSGNHAAALALAARTRGVPAFVVMPRTAPAIKKAAVAGYGAEITFCEPLLEERLRHCEEIAARTGAVVVPPYDDARIIAGQGTAALELLDQEPGLDMVVTPVGGGGLLSGTVLVCAATGTGLPVFGAEAAAANTASRSLAAGEIVDPGNPTTVCDGLRTTLGSLPFEVLRVGVRAVLPQSEDAIVAAMRMIWERTKLVTEASSAVALAAVKTHPEHFAGKSVGVILSGGNVDLARLPWSEDSGSRAPDPDAEAKPV